VPSSGQVGTRSAYRCSSRGSGSCCHHFRCAVRKIAFPACLRGRLPGILVSIHRLDNPAGCHCSGPSMRSHPSASSDGCSEREMLAYAPRATVHPQRVGGPVEPQAPRFFSLVPPFVRLLYSKCGRGFGNTSQAMPSGSSETAPCTGLLTSRRFPCLLCLASLRACSVRPT
jgi:hypothetical protein